MPDDWNHVPVKSRPMTRDEVLDRLNYLVRHDPSSWVFDDFTYDMTVEDWLFDYDGFVDDDLGPWLNEAFDINISEHNWKQLVEGEYLIGDVCDLIASQAKRRIIEPVSIAGIGCQPAGAFFAFRQSLDARGVDVSALRPSSTFNDIVDQKNGGAFYLAAVNLWGTRLPHFFDRSRFVSEIESYNWTFLFILLFVGPVAGLILAALAGIGILPFSGWWIPFGWPGGMGLFLGCDYLINRFAKLVFRFGDMKTVRDLCVGLSAQSQP